MRNTENNQNLVNDISTRLNYQLGTISGSPKGHVWNTRRRFR